VTRLRAAREARGWSQTRLVFELRRHATGEGLRLPGPESLKTELSRWENGHKRPDATYRRLFRRIFELTDEDLGFAGDTAVSQPSVVASMLTPELVEHFRALLNEFAHTDNLIGPHHLLTAVCDQAAFLERMCQVATGPDRRQLLRVATQFAEFAGWLHQDAGDFQSAFLWTDRAIAYAHELDDPRTMSYVLMRKSNIATDAHQPGPGLGLADAALRDRTRLTPRLRAVALRQQANAQAIAGNPNACTRALDEALNEISQYSEPKPPSEDPATYCTTSYVEMEAANCWLQLKQPDRAIPILEHGLSSWPGGQERDRGLCLSRLATAHAHAGDLEAACHIGHQALTVVSTARSSRSLEQLRRLRIQLASSRNVGVVADFDAAFIEFCRTAAA
jgi:transcriptional regulator with XRE-family HTH domain